jgi:hypothetical protein
MLGVQAKASAESRGFSVFVVRARNSRFLVASLLGMAIE